MPFENRPRSDRCLSLSITVSKRSSANVPKATLSGVLLDLLEKYLYLPSALIDGGARNRLQFKIVGQEHEPDILFHVVIFYAPDSVGVMFADLGHRQPDGPVTLTVDQREHLCENVFTCIHNLGFCQVHSSIQIKKSKNVPYIPDLLYF